MNVVRGFDLSESLICQNPELASNFEKYPPRKLEQGLQMWCRLLVGMVFALHELIKLCEIYTYSNFSCFLALQPSRRIIRLDLQLEILLRCVPFFVIPVRFLFEVVSELVVIAKGVASCVTLI